MALSPSKPILIREATVVPVAVGISDPSLTLVELADGIEFFLAESFQHDAFTGLDRLENVTVGAYRDHLWNLSEHAEIALGWRETHLKDREIELRKLGVTAADWPPVVFFLTAETYHSHFDSLKSRRPEWVLRAAFARAQTVATLQVRLLRLWNRHREQLERLFVPSPATSAAMKKQKPTLRVSLPPRPAR